MTKNPASLVRSLPWWALVALLALIWSQSSYFYFLVPRALATAGTATFGSSAGTGGNVYGNIFYDHDNTAFLIDPNATGTSASMAGTLSIGNGGFLRTNYGPLNLQYKSALDAWTTALTIQDTTGKVGIGTTNPGQKLSVAGTVESTTGGFKFPDASVQMGAAPFSNVQVFTSTGTFTVPSGVTRVWVEAYGGGGGGGGAGHGTNCSDFNGPGGGGGAGGVSMGFLTVTPGNNITATVGGGGGGGGCGAYGGTGGTSSFSTISATGGGGGGPDLGCSGCGGAGGTGSGGSINQTGGGGAYTSGGSNTRGGGGQSGPFGGPFISGKTFGGGGGSGSGYNTTGASGGGGGVIVWY